METLLLSPDSSPSSVAGLVSDTRALPVPRRKPLKPASQKEIALLNFVDSRILTITRRFAKKCSSDKAEDEEARGYNSFDEVAEDVEQVLNAVWVSGTRKLNRPGPMYYIHHSTTVVRTTDELSIKCQSVDISFASNSSDSFSIDIGRNHRRIHVSFRLRGRCHDKSHGQIGRSFRDTSHPIQGHAVGCRWYERASRVNHGQSPDQVGH